MCGRFALFSDINVIKKYADELVWKPHFNIAPGVSVPLLFSTPEGIKGNEMRWGFNICTAGKKHHIINVRAETIKEKWQNSFPVNRCLIPANGFYEWRKDDRQPFYISSSASELIFFAGIYRISKEENSFFPIEEKNFAIITIEANSLVKKVHHRMPVIIDPEMAKQWLSSPTEAYLNPYPVNKTEVYSVSKLVNNSRSNSRELIDKI